MNIYENDSFVGDLSRQLVERGIRVFQIFQRGTEREHVQYLLDVFSPTSGTVLDVGCGIGEVARIMKDLRNDLDFILLNISQAQLDMCPPFRKLCASVENIPLPDDAVDAVMACYVLGHVDKDAAMAEMRRVLRPGGVLFIADMTGGDMPDLNYVAHDYGGFTPDSMTLHVFDEIMPDFAEKYPNIKPTFMREVKA